MAMSISPENQKLLHDAVANGPFKTEDEALAEALRLLRDQSNGTVGDGDGGTLPPDQWTEHFRTWSRKPRQGNTNMDDSRKAIYEGRGE